MAISEDTVVIKSKAYVKMLLHVLRFGSEELDMKLLSEVMGVCVGKIENEQVVIYDAVPIRHGRKIEVKWEDNDYARFEILEENYEEGMWTVGWYHSHPRMGCFLSAADLVNHAFWQNANPKAVALVFDHVLLSEEGNMGFEIFRMDDVNLREKSNFHGVKYKVELPEDASIYKFFVEITNNIHRRDPFIVEEGEIVDLFDAFSIGTAEKPEEGDLKSYVINNTTMILQTLRDLKTSMTTGVTRLQNWYKKALREGLDTAVAKPLRELDISLYDLTEEIKKALNIKTDDSS